MLAGPDFRFPVWAENEADTRKMVLNMVGDQLPARLNEPDQAALTFFELDDGRRVIQLFSHHADESFDVEVRVDHSVGKDSIILLRYPEADEKPEIRREPNSDVYAVKGFTRYAALMLTS